MRMYTFCLSAGLAIAVMVMVLFGTAIGSAAPGDNASATVMDSSNPSTSKPVRIARRRISIPFGIDSPLALTNGGHGVLVTGHGKCEEGEESFRLQVKVRQEGVPTPAQGDTEASCTGEQQSWLAQASVKGQFALQQGIAEVCAHAVVFAPGEGSVVYQWCKEVVLE